MAKNTLIQNRFVSIPETNGTNIYSVNFKSDDLFNFLTGISCTFAGAKPTAEEIKIELRDDFKSILSFSPVENWLRNTSSESWDLSDAFKPLNTESHGKQFYLNIKVTNSSAFSFVAMFRQEQEEADVVDYDMQSFDVKAPELGQNWAITLPADYSRCRGIQVTGGDATNAQYIAFDLNDASGNIIDPVPFNVLRPSVNTQYNALFFNCDFESANKQVYARLTPLKDIEYTATNYTVTFLLVK